MNIDFIEEAMKKILYIENCASIRATSFYLSAARAAQELNMQFHVAYFASDFNNEEAQRLKDSYGVYFHQVNFHRNPFDPRNYKAFQEINTIIYNEKIDIIHCNTPIGGVVGRLSGLWCHISPVIYEVHGFHFYKGSSFFNWLLFYPIERLLGKSTDILLTINQDDYQIASRKFKLRRGGIVGFVPGVGISTEQYERITNRKKELEEELAIQKDSFVLITTGDLVRRKNYHTAIEAISTLKKKGINVEYCICGEGPESNKLQKLVIKEDVADRVHFLGYRSDIKELLKASDVFLFPSYQEGLSRSLMEAMATGLPCVVSRIRGNSDLIDGAGGILCGPNNPQEFANALEKLIKDNQLRSQMGKYNKEKIQEFSFAKAQACIAKYYSICLEKVK